jgi:hypothetical protein
MFRTARKRSQEVSRFQTRKLHEIWEAGAVKREPDNARIREALGANIAVAGAKLKRGEHVRLT